MLGRENRQWRPASGVVSTEGASDVAVVPSDGQTPARAVFCNARGGTLHEKVPPLVYWGAAAGFDPARVWKMPVNSGYEASGADLNADGLVDLISLNSGHVGEAADADPNLGANVFFGGPLSPNALHGFDEKKRVALREFGLGSSNVADLNRDGYLDIVLGAFEHDDGRPEVLVIYYGSVDGFSRDRRQAILSPHRSIGCAIGDYNRDDWLDIAVTSYASHEVRVFWGSPDGFHSERKSLLELPSPIGLETADLNADGYLDLIVGSYNDPRAGHHDTGTFIFWGASRGFREQNAQWLPGFTPVGFVVADFDANGFLDLFSPHYHADLTRESLPCYLYWGSAKGLSTRNRTILICDSADDGVAADFDRDGRLDLAVACHSRDGSHYTRSRIFYNDGRRFSSPRIEYLPTHGPHWMYVQDMGHIYNRKFEQTYESSVFQWHGPAGQGELTSKVDEAVGTELLIEVRSAADDRDLGKKEWRPVLANPFALEPTDRCLQYRATFKSDNGDRYPILDRVTFRLGS
ncbi:MAG: hypothetical protein CMJ62_15325 [Planctomycetaceae bacterium]|nr:hypothetical protein [Planctomycetaceae bacterium]